MLTKVKTKIMIDVLYVQREQTLLHRRKCGTRVQGTEQLCSCSLNLFPGKEYDVGLNYGKHKWDSVVVLCPHPPHRPSKHYTTHRSPPLSIWLIIKPLLTATQHSGLDGSGTKINTDPASR